MVCVCEELEDALVRALALASLIERIIAGVPRPSAQLRFAEAHALGVCDELHATLDEHRRAGPCTAASSQTRLTATRP